MADFIRGGSWVSSWALVEVRYGSRFVISKSRVLRSIALKGEVIESPEGSICWMTTVTLEGTRELMRCREVAVVLATGGLGLVRAAYSSGKPAYGVGPGNAPAYIERTADLSKAVADIITGKTFDNGLLCSSENSVVVDEAVAGEVRREFNERWVHLPDWPSPPKPVKRYYCGAESQHVVAFSGKW